MMDDAAYRATPPRVPAPTRRQERVAAEVRFRRAAGEVVERRRQLRGLLWVAGVVLVLSVARAGVGNVFPQGWWRFW